MLIISDIGLHINGLMIIFNKIIRYCIRIYVVYRCLYIDIIYYFFMKIRFSYIFISNTYQLDRFNETVSIVLIYIYIYYYIHYNY